MIETIERCFKEGCGISLATAVSSPRYAEILAEESALFERFPATTDEGVALRTGLLKMGAWLNTLPEEQALAAARESTLSSTYDFNTRALIRLLGEKIVEAADA